MGQPSKILADLEAYAQNWRPWKPLAVADNTRVAIPRIQIGEPKVYPIKKGETGDRVQELRIRLAGFGPLKPGHTFDDATEKSVKLFEKDVMGRSDPTGIVGTEFAKRLDLFGTEWPIHFKQLACRCCTCDGFGDGENYGIYAAKRPKAERFHMYEYPGIHRCLLWAARALMFYCSVDLRNSVRFQLFDSGYRCRFDNQAKGRSTSNHMGKAVDMHFETLLEGSWRRDRFDAKTNYLSCNKVRDIAVSRLGASSSWARAGEFGLEPGGPVPTPGIKTKPGDAPTWVHMDVREWPEKDLDDSFFAKTSVDLDGEPMEEWMRIPTATQLFEGES